MKLLAFSSTLLIGLAFHLPGNATSIEDCQRVENRLARTASHFTKLNASVIDAAPTPEKALRRLQHRNVALHDTAMRVWSLRTRMADMKCAEAENLSY